MWLNTLDRFLDIPDEEGLIFNVKVSYFRSLVLHGILIAWSDTTIV